jgi:hypothetical protein
MATLHLSGITKVLNINIISGSRMTRLYNIHGYDLRRVHILNKNFSTVNKTETY